MTIKKPVIALTGGWSGWHTMPLSALYNFLKEDDNYDFVWVGEQGGLEEEIAKKHNIVFKDIAAGKIRRYFSFKNFYEPLKNLTGICQGIYYILNSHIDIIFSKWWYVSLPLCIAAAILRKPIYVHESDVAMGLANKLISKLASKVFYTFENELTADPANTKHIHSGQILNPELIDYLDSLDVTENEKLTVMVMAGSQGSTNIFNHLLKILPQVPDVTFHIVLWDKNMHFRDDFKKFPNTLVHDFITQKRLGKILKNIDVAITRGSATTLWELTVFGIHSIIVPITLAWGHQIHNAKYFQEKYGSDIVDETQDLDTQLLEKLQKYAGLRKSGLNLDDFFKPLHIIEQGLCEK
jgi:UDP-N-acetylglucosamine--N-acetylmuramyl-(pentapeptide) pyrophosphoryl-undecaprenol N-acetylglucosamine transferase